MHELMFQAGVKGMSSFLEQTIVMFTLMIMIHDREPHLIIDVAVLQCHRHARNS